MKRTLAVVLVSLCTAGQEFPMGQSKQIIAKTYYNTFSRSHPPLAHIRPGEAVATMGATRSDARRIR